MVAYSASTSSTMLFPISPRKKKKSGARSANPRPGHHDWPGAAAGAHQRHLHTRVRDGWPYSKRAAVTSRQASVSARGYGAIWPGVCRARPPSSPCQFIVVHDDPYRPQPRLDRDTDDGMATSVGRLRADTAFDNGLQYVVLSHNTKMGPPRARYWRLRCWCTRVILAEGRGALLINLGAAKALGLSRG